MTSGTFVITNLDEALSRDDLRWFEEFAQKLEGDDTDEEEIAGQCEEAEADARAKGARDEK